ncbi:MAG TPA: hypothetical protein VLG44_03275 [Chlamydiales bacterium]|nr:hypothetical protein [Chlamydiales bacterium]
MAVHALESAQSTLDYVVAMRKKHPYERRDMDYHLSIQERQAAAAFVDHGFIEEGSVIDKLGGIFTNLQKSHRKRYGTFDATYDFTHTLADVIKKKTIKEGTRQIIVMVGSPEPAFCATADKVLDEMRSVLSDMQNIFGREYFKSPESTQFPSKPFNRDLVLKAVDDFKSKTCEQAKLLADSLCLPIVGVNEEMLPGVLVQEPTTEKVAAAVHGTLSRIASEFHRRKALLKIHDLTDVLDDSSSFSKTLLRHRLENLKIRYNTILRRIFIFVDDLASQRNCVAFLLRNTDCFPWDMPYGGVSTPSVAYWAFHLRSIGEYPCEEPSIGYIPITKAFRDFPPKDLDLKG